MQFNNVFNVTHYNHLSRIKSIMPEAGRNVVFLYKTFFYTENTTFSCGTPGSKNFDEVHLERLDDDGSLVVVLQNRFLTQNHTDLQSLLSMA